MKNRLSSLEVCAGAGGLALGLEQAGFDPTFLFDNRDVACNTLHLNRPEWDVRKLDLLEFDPAEFEHVYDVDLLSAGLPRVKAAAATNRTRGSAVELELLDATIMLLHGVQPRAVLIDNMSDLVTNDRYAEARASIENELDHLNYESHWFVVNASDHGVPQERKHGILVAFKGGATYPFQLPPAQRTPPSVGAILRESMASRGWPQADEWAAQADRLAPTLVGGSWDHGGPDLGPTGSKRLWAKIGVNGSTVADLPPGPESRWVPGSERQADMVPLTVAQAARLQGFPPDWRFSGGKTAQYRQVGNAVPPPVGHALGIAIRQALEGH
jgi:DNA (cytosine-5)-methyltransferase 1